MKRRPIPISTSASKPLPVHIAKSMKTGSGAHVQGERLTPVVPLSGKAQGVPFGAPTSKNAIAISAAHKHAQVAVNAGHTEQRRFAVHQARQVAQVAKKQTDFDLRRNATPAGIDPSNGRRVWTGAFSRSEFKQPFSTSRNLGISWG